MDLLAGGGGIDKKFIPAQRAVAAQKLAVNSFARTVLPQTGPDYKVISSRRTDPGRILIPIQVGVNKAYRSTGARARNRPRKNVPTVARYLQILLSPGHSKASIGGSCNRWVGADIGSGVDQELIAHRPAGGSEKPRINIDAILKSLLLGNPHDDEPSVAQASYDRRALVIGSRLVDRRLGADSLPEGRKELRIDALHAAVLIEAGPGDDHIPTGQGGDHGIDTMTIREGV